MRGKSANDFLAVGTLVSGYSSPNLGPFKCSNCMHRDEGPPWHCEHPMVEADARVKHDSKGRALIEPESCCAFFRKGV